MSQLDAFALSKAIRDRLVDFALDFNFVRDQQVTDICRRLWSGRPANGGLVSDLWIEGAFPSKAAEESLGDLVSQGKFDGGLQDHLDARGAVPRARRLYLHQRDAILEGQKIYQDNALPALVITAGTGAGKTESFLLPILNDLFRNQDTGKSGIKCLILYPMNALVNDQVDRIHEWLKDQDEVSLFHFTSETPEGSLHANQQGFPRWDKDAFRMRTRQEARGLEEHNGKRIDLRNHPRGRVPDILITNYSMLEYMLCRPQDAVFFGNALRSVVLDEAHLYTGTLAAEITLLLRRLLQRCGLSSQDVLHLATSATIGTGESGELENFAGKLFSKPTHLVKVIRGQIQETVFPEVAPPEKPATAGEIARRTWLTASTQSADGKSLTPNAEQCRSLGEDLSLLVAEGAIADAQLEAKEHPALLLYHVLGRAPILHLAKKILDTKNRMPLPEFARQLWGEASEDTLHATIFLLQMGASARTAAGAYPLLPHRLHLLARPTDGLVVCLNEKCSGDADLHIDGFGCVMAGYSDHCPHCHGATMSLHRCANCGEISLAGIGEGSLILPVPVGDYEGKSRHFTFREIPGSTKVFLDVSGGERRGVFEIKSCPNCDPSGEEKGNLWRPFVTSAQLTLSILAETALAELPEVAEQNNEWLPARGRRMLAFSDSRQEAARLGPRLRLQHEIQLMRAALAHCAAQSPAADDSTVEYWRHQITSIEAQLALSSLSPALRQTLTLQLDQARRQLETMQQGGSIEIWLELLKRDKDLCELLHAETAHKHRPEEWRSMPKRASDENFAGIVRNLRRLLGRELARAPLRREFSVETVGLLEVTYPGLDRIPLPLQIAGNISIAARDTLATAWPDFLAALCDSLRTDGVVSLGGTNEDDYFQFGGIPIGRWCAEDRRRGNYLISFIGVRETQRRRQFAQVVLEKCGIPREQAVLLAPDLLRAAFRELKIRAGSELPWLKTERQQTNDSPVEGIQIYFPSLALRRPHKLYRCQLTGHIWPRSVLGCAPESVSGTLEQISEDILDNDPRAGRQRREFKESKIFKLALWAEEHSAQLSPKENRRLQDLFKIGARNILSSTTTLELGIDIGGLNAVLMSNVPPGKANYLQRAGRAGRRADGSSIVITYVRPRPFDREVFARFGDYLERSYRRPQIFLDRQRVVRRHGNAYLLGEFFRQVYPPGTEVGAMSAFGNMGSFCGVPFIPYWERTSPKPALIPGQPNWQVPTSLPWFNQQCEGAGLEKHFLDFLEYLRPANASEYLRSLNEIFKGTQLKDEIEDWAGFLDRLIRSFKDSIGDWRNEYDNLLAAWNGIEEAGMTDRGAAPRAHANMVYYQARALYETTVIEALADRQFLPRYGFPIGLQKLRVIQPNEDKPARIREEDQYRLERAGLLALREYVPGSQLLVGGKLVTSRGLLKHWTGADLDNYIGLRGICATCERDHTYYEISKQIADCPICGAPAAGTPRALLLPKHGFTSAAWDPPRLSADVERVGSIEQATITFAKSEGKADLSDEEFAGIKGLSARYREAGEILVYNEGENNKGFAICLQCGYADSEVKYAPEELPRGFEEHARLTAVKRDYSCWGRDNTPPLRNQVLAARQTTDVLLIAFTGALLSHVQDASLMKTFGHALQIAGAKLLELDTRELGVMVASASDLGEGVGAVLYDNVPGGAGHVRELFARKREWLEEGLNVMFVSEEHDVRCETACLDCLLTYDAQEAMSKGLLRRRAAYLVLKELLSGSSPAAKNDQTLESYTQKTETVQSDRHPASTMSKEERIDKAKLRSRK